MIGRVLAAAAIVCIVARPLQGAEVILVRNSMGEPLTLLMYIQAYRTWKQPYLLMQPDELKPIELTWPGKTFIRIKDQQGRRDELGWRDLHAIARDNPPGTELQLRYFYEQRTRTVPTTEYRTEERVREVPVTRMVPQMRTRTVLTRDPRTGQLREVQQQYTVEVPVMEMRTMTYTVQVPQTREVEQVYTVRVPGIEIVTPEAHRDEGDAPSPPEPEPVP